MTLTAQYLNLVLDNVDKWRGESGEKEGNGCERELGGSFGISKVAHWLLALIFS